MTEKGMSRFAITEFGDILVDLTGVMNKQKLFVNNWTFLRHVRGDKRTQFIKVSC